MNFIQKKPLDSKHEEFHDGEYEFWPTEHLTKKKRAGFSAAFGSGLELIAAVGASGLLSMALTILYVLSSALSIGEHSAVINANVYNNRENQHISYILTTEANQDVILKEGILEDDEETLTLGGLGSGTTYLLRYFDPDQKEIGHFLFTTLGEFEDPIDPDSGSDVKQPAAPEPDDRKDPVEDPEAEKEPEVETEAVTEPKEEPIVPGYRPPVVPPAKPKPTPEEEPEEGSEPNPKPVVPEGPAADKPTSKYKLVRDASGNLDGAYYDYQETHNFRNISDNYKVYVLRKYGGEEWEPTENDGYTVVYEDGILKIALDTLYVDVGAKTTTRIIVTNSDGTKVESTCEFAPPLMDKENVELIATANNNNGHNFTIKVPVVPEGAETMTCWANVTFKDASDVTLVTQQNIQLEKESSSDTYIGTGSVNNVPSASRVTAEINSSWSKNGKVEYSDIYKITIDLN